MASKSSIINNTFLLIKRRSYAVAAENARVGVQGRGSLVMGKVKEVSSMDQKKEVFWMRDPKTGNWIPESHFNQIDAAELRNKFLPNTKNN